MASVCCGGETETSAPVEPSSKAARRRRMEIHQFKFLGAEMAPEGDRKRQRLETVFPAKEEHCGDGVGDRVVIDKGKMVENGDSEGAKDASQCETSSSAVEIGAEVVGECPNFGMTSVCGRRRDMEDAVAIHPSFSRSSGRDAAVLHFFGVYDGHGCSHVAMKCRDRMHEIVKDEVEVGEEGEGAWKEVMARSFSRMDKEVTEWSNCGAVGVSSSICRCELQTPQCDAVGSTAGSTAVVAVVTPDKIVVSNCGDSRAVLCRNGVAIPLSLDHKPDRPDELNRIQAAGGRVIDWDGARVLGVLAMSRAIGDNYLKPFVIPEPEVTVTDRTAEDECLILASDGLWDVVPNEIACGVARTCLRAQKPPSPGSEASLASFSGEISDKACSDASILLTKLALARHSTDNVSVVVVDLRRDPQLIGKSSF